MKEEEVKKILKGFRFHSSLDYKEEISDGTALECAKRICQLFQPPDVKKIQLKDGIVEKNWQSAEAWLNRDKPPNVEKIGNVLQLMCWNLVSNSIECSGEMCNKGKGSNRLCAGLKEHQEQIASYFNVEEIRRKGYEQGYANCVQDNQNMMTAEGEEIDQLRTDLEALKKKLDDREADLIQAKREERGRIWMELASRALIILQKNLEVPSEEDWQALKGEK